MNMQLSENVTLITHTNIYFESMLFLYFIMLYNVLSSSLGFVSDLELCTFIVSQVTAPMAAVLHYQQYEPGSGE